MESFVHLQKENKTRQKIDTNKNKMPSKIKSLHLLAKVKFVFVNNFHFPGADFMSENKVALAL